MYRESWGMRSRQAQEWAKPGEAGNAHRSKCVRSCANNRGPAHDHRQRSRDGREESAGRAGLSSFTLGGREECDVAPVLVLRHRRSSCVKPGG